MNVKSPCIDKCKLNLKTDLLTPSKHSSVAFALEIDPRKRSAEKVIGMTFFKYII